MESAIEVTGLLREYVTETGFLTRRRHEVQALRGISFDVRRGEIFGVLGPNGAGKTTLIKILSTMLSPSGGSARVLGFDVHSEAKRIRPRINVIFGGERSLYWRLTGSDNMRYFSDLYRVPEREQRHRIPELLELVGLQEKADVRVETYSKGMKQRLQIARGLVNRPEVLYLDEPSIGLDPIAAAELRRIVARLADQGTTIILTTHYMFEAEQLCRRIAVVDHGQIQALDTPEGLKRLAVGQEVVEVEVGGLLAGDLAQLRALPGVRHVAETYVGQCLLLTMQSDDPEQIESVLTGRASQYGLTAVRRRAASLEDAYLRLVGEAR